MAKVGRNGTPKHVYRGVQAAGSAEAVRVVRSYVAQREQREEEVRVA